MIFIYLLIIEGKRIWTLNVFVRNIMKYQLNYRALYNLISQISLSLSLSLSQITNLCKS